jgi:hypothetical protein
MGKDCNGNAVAARPDLRRESPKKKNNTIDTDEILYRDKNNHKKNHNYR